MKKHKYLFITLILLLVALCSTAVFAADEPPRYGMKSQGIIQYAGENGTPGDADDIIFDASDIYKIAAKCQ